MSQKTKNEESMASGDRRSSRGDSRGGVPLRWAVGVGRVSRLEHSWNSESSIAEKTQVVKHLTWIKGESRCGQVAKNS